MADVRIRRGSEAWVKLADAMADESVSHVELVIGNRMRNRCLRLIIDGRRTTPRMVADASVPDDPPA